MLLLLGIIFALQSKSIVGPSSSFMYHNPDWIVNGSIIIGIEISILVCGSLLFGISFKSSTVYINAEASEYIGTKNQTPNVQ